MTKSASPRLRPRHAGGRASFVGHTGLCETAFALCYRRLSHRVNRTQGRERTPLRARRGRALRQRAGARSNDSTSLSAARRAAARGARQARRQRSRNHFDSPARKISREGKKTLASITQRAYVASAQFRTCLWPRAGWWASGQEAGQPPGVRPRLKAKGLQPQRREHRPLELRTT